MEILVLGKSPSWQDADGAGSGYLVRHDGFTLLLDCGSGVFAKLRTACDYTDVDAVLISHLHPDHFIDLIAFSFALRFAPRRQSDPDGRRRPPLHVPPDALSVFRLISSCWKQADQMEEAFEVREYTPEERLSVGPFSVRFCEVPHYSTRSFACELTAGPGRFTFGADCGPNEALVEFARGTDLLMLESTLVEPEADEVPGHMTPTEAGTLARRAEAKRLVVTHFSDELDAGRIHEESARAYGGEVTLAEPGASYLV